jgi:LPXTG-site transpeptidase (sortase) family protein
MAVPRGRAVSSSDATAVRSAVSIPARDEERSAIRINPVRPLPKIQPAHRPTPTQIGTANVVRSQINQIYDSSGATEQSADHIAVEAAKIASKKAKVASIREAHRRYHTAWQQYYQKYYERYYVAALEQQRAKLAEEAKKESVLYPKTENSGAKHDESEKKGTRAQDRIRADIKRKLSETGKKVRKSRHFFPAMAAVAVIIAVLFIQYNQFVVAGVADWIGPGSITSNNMIIGSSPSQPVSQTNQLIIPKINAVAPITFGLSDLSENSVQTALQDGLVHYPIRGASAHPGQNGTTAILGHSAADWFEPGNYKLVFRMLNRLVAGDLFYIDYQGVRYTYRVTGSKAILPTEVDALNLGTDKPYAALVTCDPPGNNSRRLVVMAEQIAPNPSNATTQDVVQNAPERISGASPTLFERIFGGN